MQLRNLAKNKNLSYDFAIVGGGLVGASLAIALQNAGFKIALIEAKQKNPDDKRLFALNHQSIHFLQSIDIWEALEKYATPIKHVHVSRQKRFGIVNLDHREVGLDSLGQVIEAARIEGILINKLLDASESRHDNCDFFCPMQLVAMAEKKDHVELILKESTSSPADARGTGSENFDSINANYVIGADGTNSMVRKLMNFVTEEHQTNEIAIVGEITVDCFHQHTAYERFFSEGVLALLPRNDNMYALILTVKQERAKEMLSWNEIDLLQYIQKIIGNRVGQLLKIKVIGFYPVQFKLAKNAVTLRTVLIGNALHTLSPVAAQGFNLAMFEIATLIEYLNEARESETEIKLAEIVKRFSKQEVFSITISRSLSKLTQRTFLNDLLMQMSFCALETLPFVKKRLLKSLLHL